MKVNVHIEWEHGDADATSKETFKFPSEEEANEFLNFLYVLKKITLSQNKKFYHFIDGHYQREWAKENGTT